MSTEFKDWLLQFYARPSHTLMLLDLKGDGNVIGYYYHAWDQIINNIPEKYMTDRWMLY
jgi:hypothetical protein